MYGVYNSMVYMSMYKYIYKSVINNIRVNLNIH